MNALILLLVIALLLVLWAVGGRAWLKRQPWGWSQRFFARLEPVELALWRKSETILFARLKVLSGALLGLLTQLGAINLDPLVSFFPTKYQDAVRPWVAALPLVISVVGLADEYLRRTTTKPLAVVAVPDAAPPEVAAAVARVEASNEAAVERVTESRAEGAI